MHLLRLPAVLLAFSALWVVSEPSNAPADLLCKALLFCCSVILLHHGLTGTVPRSLNDSLWMRHLLSLLEAEPPQREGDAESAGLSVGRQAR